MGGLALHALSAAELLRGWEAGRSEELPIRQATALLAAACDDVTAEELARLSVGQLDGYLLTLREWTFGSHLNCTCRCPECGQVLEMGFRVSELRRPPDGNPSELVFAGGEYEVRFRLPTGADLAAISPEKELEANRRHLLDNCVLGASRCGKTILAAELPEIVVHALSERMGEADPQADLRLKLTCPACAHSWDSLFDISSFLWEEVNAWAKRTLYDIHVLASAYGWTEPQVLALSPLRRQAYLDMIGA